MDLSTFIQINIFFYGYTVADNILNCNTSIAKSYIETLRSEDIVFSEKMFSIFRLVVVYVIIPIHCYIFLITLMAMVLYTTIRLILRLARIRIKEFDYTEIFKTLTKLFYLTSIHRQKQEFVDKYKDRLAH